MSIRANVRRAAKWGGLVATVAVAAVFVATVWWFVSWYDGSGGGQRLGGGVLTVARWTSAAPPLPQYAIAGLGYGWNQEDFRWWPDWGSDGRWHVVRVPLWIPLLLFGVPTAWLWWPGRWWDQRNWPGHCRGCGYDLRGLRDGARCPECGRG